MRRRYLLALIFSVCNLVSFLPDAIAQVIGEAAELDRLVHRADEAIAVGDPGTASMTIGKAALMASILAQQAKSPSLAILYKSAEAIFRAQENGYRALALFEQAGGHPPAPSSVCRLLSLAARHHQAAETRLSQVPADIGGGHQHFYRQLEETTQEWHDILQELRHDFDCS